MDSISVFFTGYLNRPEANEEFFGSDGFVHTGDLGSYDTSGFIFFEGRSKDLIKYKNNHIYPLEIENIIRNIPDVIDVGVFGRPEHTVQELITAVVVKRTNSDLTEDEIIQRANESLEDVKKIRGGVIFVDKLPKNPQGKILRRKLSELYDEVSRN